MVSLMNTDLERGRSEGILEPQDGLWGKSFPSLYRGFESRRPLQQSTKGIGVCRCPSIFLLQMSSFENS